MKEKIYNTNKAIKLLCYVMLLFYIPTTFAEEINLFRVNWIIGQGTLVDPNNELEKLEKRWIDHADVKNFDELQNECKNSTKSSIVDGNVILECTLSKKVNIENYPLGLDSKLPGKYSHIDYIFSSTNSKKHVLRFKYDCRNGKEEYEMTLPEKYDVNPVKLRCCFNKQREKRNNSSK